MLTPSIPTLHYNHSFSPIYPPINHSIYNDLSTYSKDLPALKNLDLIQKKFQGNNSIIETKLANFEQANITLIDKTIKLKYNINHRLASLFDDEINPNTQCETKEFLDELKHTNQINRKINGLLKTGSSLIRSGSEIYHHSKCINGDVYSCSKIVAGNVVDASIQNNIVLFRDDDSLASKVKTLFSSLPNKFELLQYAKKFYFLPKCMKGEISSCIKSIGIETLEIALQKTIPATKNPQTLISKTKEVFSKTVDRVLNTHLSYTVSQICFAQKRWKDGILHIIGNNGIRYLKSIF